VNKKKAVVVNKSVTFRLSFLSVGRVKLFALKMITDCQPFGTWGRHVFPLSLAHCEYSVMAQICAERGSGHSGVGMDIYMYAEQSLRDATAALQEDGHAWILLSKWLLEFFFGKFVHPCFSDSFRRYQFHNFQMSVDICKALCCVPLAFKFVHTACLCSV